MKKMDNKGFAVSTLLYGLMLVAFLVVSLLISIMSTNRRNTSTLVKKIEEELNRYSQTVTEFTSTDGAQEFIVPYGKAGWYKIELWGAAAYQVDTVTEKEKRRGSYTSGIIYLEENQHLYFQIGTIGTNNASASKNNIDKLKAGGATDVRLEGGAWNSESGLNSRIMVAAGGGYDSSNKGSGYGGNGLCTIYNDGCSYISGLASPSPIIPNFNFLNPTYFNNINAGAGKAKIELIYSSDRNNPPPTKISTLKGIKAVRDCIWASDTTSSAQWKEIQVIDKFGKNLARESGVKAYFGTLTELNSSLGVEITTINDGSFELQEPLLKKDDGQKCIELRLNGTYDVEDVVAFHGVIDGNTETIYSLYTYVQKSNNSWIEVRGWPAEDNDKASPHETRTGTRISDRNFYINGSATIPTGNYYIQSALANNRVVSTAGGSGQIKMYTGDKTDRWAVENISGSLYKITDSENLKALQPSDGGVEVGETISNSSKYGGHLWEQWQITQAINPTSGNGYVMLKTNSGNNLCLATENTSRNNSGLLRMKTCNNLDRSQWFKFICADY